jgi:hypothetical protein
LQLEKSAQSNAFFTLNFPGTHVTFINMSTIKTPRRIIPIARSALRVREWEKANLPNAQSGLALDLFLVISYNTLIGQPLTLKTLFYSLEFSEAGIRKQLRKLIDDEWISIEGNGRDKRLKHVIAEPKMLTAMDEYSRLLKLAFRRSAPPPPLIKRRLRKPFLVRQLENSMKSIDSELTTT